MAILEDYDGSGDEIAKSTNLQDSGDKVKKRWVSESVYGLVKRFSASSTGSDEINSICYSGLLNQGRTCYLNTVLQVLFHKPALRAAIFCIHATGLTRNGTVLGALQKLFYKMECFEPVISTKELTESLGWAQKDVYTDEDYDEKSDLFCRYLEQLMEGTWVDGTIGRMYGGISIHYKGTGVAEELQFRGIHLTVKGCKDVYESLDHYTGAIRNGDEEHGNQGATKKVNDHYEFPLELDMDRDNRRYFCHEADKNVRNLYTLCSVTVHSGGAGDGHYYSYIRPVISPDLRGDWYLFNDTFVTKVDEKSAVFGQYGGERRRSFISSRVPQFKDGSAYVLEYVRTSDIGRIFCPIEEDNYKHIQARLKKEEEEQEFKKKVMGSYINVKVDTDRDMLEQVGNPIVYDLLDFDSIESILVEKGGLFMRVKEMLSRKLGIPVSEQRYWFWKQRVNGAWRPLRPLTAEEETKTVDELRRINNEQLELRLYLETETVLLSKDMHMIFRPPTIGANERLVFFKVYNTMEGKVRYVGHCFVDKSSRPMQLEYWLNKMAHVGDCKVIEQLYMEVGKYPVVRFIALNKGKTFDENKVDLKNGDIICFQFEEAQREEVKAKDWKPNTKRLKRRMRVTFCMGKREDSPPPAPRLQPQTPTPTPPRPQPPSSRPVFVLEDRWAFERARLQNRKELMERNKSDTKMDEMKERLLRYVTWAGTDVGACATLILVLPTAYSKFLVKSQQNNGQSQQNNGQSQQNNGQNQQNNGQDPSDTLSDMNGSLDFKLFLGFIVMSLVLAVTVLAAAAFLYNRMSPRRGGIFLLMVAVMVGVMAHSLAAACVCLILALVRHHAADLYTWFAIFFAAWFSLCLLLVVYGCSWTDAVIDWLSDTWLCRFCCCCSRRKRAKDVIPQ